MIDKHYNIGFNIYRVSSSIDANNFEIETQSLNLSNMGYIEPLSGNERYMSDKKEAYTTHRLFCKILDVVESDEIHVGSDTYDIDLIQNFRENHLELILILRK